MSIQRSLRGQLLTLLAGSILLIVLIALFSFGSSRKRGER